MPVNEIPGIENLTYEDANVLLNIQYFSEEESRQFFIAMGVIAKRRETQP